MLSKLTFPLRRTTFRNLRGFASPSTPAPSQSAAEWRAALRFLCLSDLAYTTPESASTIDAESDAIEHVEKLCSEKYKAFGIEAPSKAYFYSAAKTGKRGQDAQYYTLVFRDSIVFAIRGTDSLLDAKVDANIIRSWLSDVAYGRCVTSAKHGIGEDMYQELMASVYAHSGFKKHYVSLRNSMMGSLVAESLMASSPKKIVFVGHSLGGAVATITAAATIANFGLTFPIECHTFGSPHPGNSTLANFFDKYIGRTGGNTGVSRRYVNAGDPVPQMLNPAASLGFYQHVGGEVFLPPPTGRRLLDVKYHKLMAGPDFDGDYTTSVKNAAIAAGVVVGDSAAPPQVEAAAGATEAGEPAVKPRLWFKR